MLIESLAKLDFECRQEANQLEEYIIDYPEKAAIAIVALRQYAVLLECGLSAHEARETIWLADPQEGKEP